MSTRPNLIWAVVKDDNDGDPKARGNSRGGLVEEFYFSRSERPMTPENADAHERAIRDQFSRQAVGFAAAPELHADDIVALVVHAAKPQPEDKAIDLACGPGTVACALAPRVRRG
jgi:hypothetical protein